MYMPSLKQECIQIMRGQGVIDLEKSNEIDKMLDFLAQFRLHL